MVWSRHSDRDGSLVRAYSTDPDEELLEEELEAGQGMNRLVWDLRHTDVFRVPQLYVFGGLQGRRVVPGDYTVRLSHGESEAASLSRSHWAWIEPAFTPSGSRESLSTAKKCTGPRTKS